MNAAPRFRRVELGRPILHRGGRFFGGHPSRCGDSDDYLSIEVRGADAPGDPNVVLVTVDGPT